MNFELTDDQQAIRRTARDFLAARYRPERIRQLAEDERGFSDAEWKALAELGWPGVIVPERFGGLGLGVVELIVLAEELGYALAPSPLLPSLWAALLLGAVGTERQQQRWLQAMADGEARGTVAVWDEHSGFSPEHSEAELLEGRLSAVKIAVPDAAAADFVIVSGADGGHFLVETGADGVSVAAEAALDSTRKLFRVVLSDAPAERLSGGGSGALARAYGAIVTSLAAENVGVAQRAMEMAVAYARDRKQFDRPIGVNQAVSHRCAQMLLEVEGARSLSYGAAWALDHSPERASRAASMAKAYAGDAGFRVTASSLQVHGGIGFTWEHDLHFFLKRAKANAHAFGDSRWHRERVVALSGL